MEMTDNTSQLEASAHVLGTLPVAEHLDFLRKLSSDDAFREDLAARPVEVLEQHGITVAPAAPAKAALPPKDAVTRICGEEQVFDIPPIWSSYLYGTGSEKAA